MNLLPVFNLQRFWLLLKMELFRSKKGILITFVVTFGMLFTGFIIENVFTSHRTFDAHPVNYALFLLIGGFILSSMTFHDLGNPLRRYSYLTLPASTFEKFFSMWLLSTAGWIIMFSITYTVYTWAANSIGHVFFKKMMFLPFQPWSEIPLMCIRYYLIFQAIFLVGAVHFRGYVFPKTLFALLIFAMVCGFTFYLIMASVIHPDTECTKACNPLKNKMILQYLHIAQWLLWWILAPVCWIISYIGLKEQEV